ncbi:RNA polymerase sigma-70 factor [Olivibacter ginsenosidimutans]|uniref:RNA polymerase sigma-70 factor n=1 Tax=Olivibacter ginsenosidimutans TaxID=1176537 RepID=A0ABP9AF48_9SPHI
MMIEKSDAIYLQKITEGDESAFSILYHKYWESLFKYVIRILQDEDEVADVIQETFVTFWELRSTLDRIRSAKAYLFIMARNFAFKRLRENLKKKENFERFVAFYGEALHQADDVFDIKELNKLLEGAISALPERMREVFLLSRKEHLSYKEIADRLQISDLTVKKQINNALKALKLSLDEEYIPYLLVLIVVDILC